MFSVLPKEVRAELPTVCATVKIEIQQELTLERQGFVARMRIQNGLDTTPLSNVGINVAFTDKAENPVEVATPGYEPPGAKFFMDIDAKSGIDAIDGTGVIAAGSAAEIDWLIVPSPGAGGQHSTGELYFVGATLTYTVGGEAQTINVTPDSIYVKPMPSLRLDYFLTEQVYSDDPGTELVVEPAEPFTLGVRIKNNGHGPANKLTIETAQPIIKEGENGQGLLIGFTITGASVNDGPAAPSLLMDFGDIPAKASRVGRWVMETSLSGKFTDFSATFTHADELGGQLTSLIEENPESAHLLVHDVRVDSPGSDGVRDFLAYKSGGNILFVFESNGVDTEVPDHSAGSALTETGVNGEEVTYDLTVTVPASPPPVSAFSYIQLPDPRSGAKSITDVVRTDGKRLPTDNAWLSKTRDASGTGWDYWINFFDRETTGAYRVVLGPSMSGPRPPALQPIADRTTHEGKPVAFFIQAGDPDGTIPVLTAAPLPFGATFTDQGNGKGIFDWTPGPGQAGTYLITYTASDGTLVATKTATIQVNPANDTDGDGMDDAWELEKFGSLDRDGTGDFDGDGLSDLEEFQQQRDPLVVDGPDAPRIQSPLYDAEADQLQPTLTVRNVPGRNGVTVSYAFEVYSDEAMTTLVAGAANVAEGSETTSWTLDTVLSENQWYSWRVRAFDGTYYSLWTEGRFFVNTVNDPPTAPVTDAPADGTQVSVLRPVLRVVKARDPDGDELSYAFRVFEDIELLRPITGRPYVSENIEGATKWQVDTDLQEGVTYYWQALVRDGKGRRSESPAQSFTINTTNQIPGAFWITEPAIGSEVVGQSALLTVTNAVDADGDTLTYYFEKDTFPTFEGVAFTAGPIAEGATTTSVAETGLADNSRYYWRAKASDGTGHSPWVYGEFFANSSNDAPGVPVHANPGHLSWVRSGQPRLEVRPVLDVDGDSLTYEFELYADSTLSTLVEAGTGSSPAWSPVATVADNRSYYWRARAVDAHGLAGSWSGATAFFVNDNDIDDAPVIEFLDPAVDTTPGGNSLTLRWHDEDPDSDAQIALYYDTDGAGADGTLITEGIDESAEGSSDLYTWDLSSLTPGNYHLYAVITDAANSFAVYAPGIVTKAADIDTDGDGILDGSDNCLRISNADQRDSNGDGYGNQCDGDFDNNGYVGHSDYLYFNAVYAANDGDADFNGNGLVDPADLLTLWALYGLPPGPSGLVDIDTDGDWIPDSRDNCQLESNPGQIDTNRDGYGNRCDADLNNDGIVNTTDLAIFKAAYFTTDPDADFDDNEWVTGMDLVIFKKLFGLPPGPSGLVP